jgi:DNA repair protein RecN (Recombination protein N)
VAVLEELRVENLLLLERAELRLAPGLNVLTGETGAGKTLLAHALDLLLGGRARSGIVRQEAPEAYVEGVFSLPEPLEPALRERIPEGAEELVLARRVWPDGRTRAYVCGRSATLADLRDLGGRLLSFYGQHEHRRLMLAAAQLEILDEFCGEPALVLRQRVAAAHERRRALAGRLEELRDRAAGRERELDVIAFELREIEAAAPDPGERQELSTERDRLRHLETLRQATALGAEALMPEEGEGMAAALLDAAGALQAAARLDPALAEAAARLESLRYEVEDLAGELRSYLARIEAEPARLEQVEERLDQLARLERKYGGDIEQVLEYAERARERLAQLEGAEVALEETERELAGAEQELERRAAQLSELRTAAAPRLAAAVNERLAELAMAEASFEVALAPREGGCGARGADRVELTLKPGAGVPAGPLREIASGGELSRVMLALLSVAHSVGGERAGGGGAGRSHRPGAGLLVFDEVDAGIGGHTARAVGEHLRRLAQGRQILCITHLPQVAALAQRHFTIAKDASRSPALTTVSALDGERVVGELVRMLGADDGDRAASRHARELLRAA